MQKDPAVLIDVNTLQASTYEHGEGWNPNYVIPSWGTPIYRVHIVGTVIEVLPEQCRCTLDDSTGVIIIKSFEDNALYRSLQVGDTLRVIGKLGQYQDALYIKPESMKRLDSVHWIALHKTQLAYFEKRRPIHAHDTPLSKEDEHDYAPVLDIINELDKGEGAQKEEILEKLKKKLKIEDPQGVLEQLLLHGDVFEVKPGCIKVLQ
ncbi:MAG: hypothetical protein ACMXYC_03845 [Candidatus Woesearchaeota archaeon]